MRRGQSWLFGQSLKVVKQREKSIIIWWDILIYQQREMVIYPVYNSK
jgi:hypothetical protein